MNEDKPNEGDSIEVNKNPEGVTSVVGQEDLQKTPQEVSVPTQAPKEPAESNQNIHTPKAKKSRKKKLIITIVILVLLIGAGAAAWFFVVKKDTATTAPTTQSSEQQTLTEINTGKTPDKVIYSYREKDTDPYILYSRPASGGERTELVKLEGNEFFSNYDVNKNVVVYSADQGIYVSTDSGIKFSKVFDIDKNAGVQITSLKISTEANRVAFGYLPAVGGKNTVKTMDLDGKNQVDLFTTEKSGVFIDGWSDNGGKMVYGEGCYNCDGNATIPMVYSVKTEKSTTLSPNIKPGTMIDFDINGELLQVVVVYGNVDKTTEGLGLNIVAPYTLSRIDLNSGAETAIKTIGTLGEKNPNGTVRSRSVLAGFISKSNDVYYTDDKGLYFLTGTSSSAVFNATANILDLPFVSNDVVIYSFGDASTGDYDLNNFSTTTKKDDLILKGDTKTIIFGVTTK